MDIKLFLVLVALTALCVVGAICAWRRAMSARRNDEASSLLGAVLMTLFLTVFVIGRVWFWP